MDSQNPNVNNADANDPHLRMLMTLVDGLCEKSQHYGKKGIFLYVSGLNVPPLHYAESEFDELVEVASGMLPSFQPKHRELMQKAMNHADEYNEVCIAIVVPGAALVVYTAGKSDGSEKASGPTEPPTEPPTESPASRPRRQSIFSNN